jgi:hypothetical protein
MKKEMVGGMPGNILGMMADLNLKLQQGNISPKQLELFLKKQNPFSLPDYSRILSDWEKFYRKLFGLKIDFSGVSVPEASEEFSWFVCVPEGFSAEQAFSGGEKQFNFWKYTDKPLDDVLNLSFGRDEWKNSYIIRCRLNYEADEDLRNLSANAISEQHINTMTLRERLLLGRFIFWKERRHLDVNNITLCAGSRYSNGRVPSVRWSGNHGGVCVSWCGPGDAGDDLRSRRAVS